VAGFWGRRRKKVKGIGGRKKRKEERKEEEWDEREGGNITKVYPGSRMWSRDRI